MKFIPKKRMFEILEIARAGDLTSKAFDFFIIVLILLNVIAVMFETVESIFIRFQTIFRTFEILSVAIFSVEYFLRVLTCTADERFPRPITGRIRFALTPLAIIDLIAILPFYIPFILPLDLRFIRIFRIFRLFKLGRYSASLRTLGNVLIAKAWDLGVIAFIVLILLVCASCLMYFVEHGAQPLAFSSIPAAMWWGVATLTTVGYGDIYPITYAGKCMGAIVAILGIGMFALPAGILASGFAEELQKRRGNRSLCPYCGKEIDSKPT